MTIRSHENVFIKALHVIQRRLGEQGPLTTLLWMYGRGLPSITGVPILRFCKVTPSLYVGSQYRSNGKKVLTEHGIDAVVNLRIEYDDAAHGLAPEHYCYLPTIDDQAPTLEQLDEGVKFIKEVIGSGKKVYIHCGAGVGRAPTMAAAYLISTGISLADSLTLIRRARPFIYIMPPQMKQLEIYAANGMKRRT